MGASLQQIIDVQIRAIVAGLKEVQKLQTELKGLEKTAGKKLSVNLTGLDKALNLFRQLSPTGDAAISKLQGIEKASGTSFGGLTTGAGIAGTALLATGGALAFVYSKLNELVQKAIEVGSRFHDLSIATGLSVETLSGLEDQARQSNVTLEDLGDGAFFLQKNLKAAAEGNKDLQRSFAKVGITDFNAALSDMDGTLRKVLKGLAEMPEEGKRNAAGADIMGRAYKQLRVFVEDLNGDVDGAIEKSRKLGLVMSQETADGADRLGDRMDELRLRFERVRVEIGGRFLNTTEHTLGIIDELLDQNNKKWDGWADGVLGSLSRGISGILSAANAVRLFSIGPSQASLDEASTNSLTDEAVQNFKRALRKPASEDFKPGGGKSKAGRESQLPELLQQLKAKGVELAAKIREGVLKANATGDEQTFNLLKDSLEREKTLLEKQLEDRLTSIKDYYAEAGRVQQESILAEIANEQRKQRDLAAGLAGAQRKINDDLKAKEAEIDAKGGKTPQSERDAQKQIAAKDAEIKRAEAIQAFNEKNAQSEERITILKREQKKLGDDNTRNADKAVESLRQQTEEIQRQILELQGRSSDAASSQIRSQFKQALKDALSNPGEDDLHLLDAQLEPLFARIDELGGVGSQTFKELLAGVGGNFEQVSEKVKGILHLIDLLIQKSKVAENIFNFNTVNDARQNSIALAQAKTPDNLVAQYRLGQQIVQINKQYLSELEDIVLAEEERVRLSLLRKEDVSQEDINNVRRLRIELEQAKREQQDFNQELKNTAIDATATGLQNLFHDIVTGAKSAKEAMRDFLLSLLDALEQVIIKMIVVKILSIALGIASGGSGSGGFDGDGIQSAGEIAGHAEGGLMPATPGGRIIRVAEGGHDEVVLTTDPKHRSRTAALLAAFLERTNIMPGFAAGGFVSGDHLLASLSAHIPRMAAGGFISDIPVGGNLAGAGGSSTSNTYFQFARPEDKGFRIPSRATFRDAARALRGSKS